MWERVAKLEDIEVGKSMTVDWKGRAIALFRTKDAVYAIDGVCPHRGGPLGEGYLEESVVTCPWHGWSFDVKTGECRSVPQVKQKCFTVECRGDEVFLEVQ